MWLLAGCGGDDITCHNATGCSSEYTSQYCDIGCNFGHCGPQGYSLCCSKTWRLYNVYGATQCGGNQDCGVDCGLVVHSSSRTRHLHPRKAALHLATKVGLDQHYLSDHEMLFVPNHCQHTYGILYLSDFQQQHQAASQRGRAVPSGGGL